LFNDKILPAAISDRGQSFPETRLGNFIRFGDRHAVEALNDLALRFADCWYMFFVGVAESEYGRFVMAD
jgi:hypothetical protein